MLLVVENLPSLGYPVAMREKITLQSHDLDGYLTAKDEAALAEIGKLYDVYLDECRKYDPCTGDGQALTRLSAGISGLRDPKTGHEEFLYYIQRAYELLFTHVFADQAIDSKRSIIQTTPVTDPAPNYAVHRIPDIDPLIHDCVMCVMLRGALLPSMIVSKEIQDYSSDGYITPFALFRIKRDESCTEKDMRYVLDLDKSFFSLEELDGKDLVFADPMNATGGSLVTIVEYLEKEGVRPKSIRFINVISALKGSLRVVRALPQAEVYTLWMDPVLNSRAYIMPGLGDAGDRLNGEDGDRPRNIIQLVADYGQAIVNLYRDQVRKIEETVLG